MRAGLALAAVLLSALPRWPLNLCVAEGQPTPQTTSFRVQYTLIIANSPDCDRSTLVDDFPIRVQYRMITTSDDGGQNNNSVSEWMDSPNMPGTRPMH